MLSASQGGRPPTPDPSLKTVGKYRVDGIIGRGNIGIVYRGFDLSIDRPVAIKTLRAEVLDTVDDKKRLLDRFASEAKSAGRCQHPNIVTVFDYVEQDGTPYIIMECIDAGTLENVVRSGRLLPLQQVGEVMAQLLGALGHAHQRGVVHRDVKPANVLCPAATSIKVTDFGVARLQDLGLTQAGGGALGTPNYMSPEQFLGREVDGRADLFAAGIILFELITGTKPFVASTVPELLCKVLNDPFPKLSLYRPEINSKVSDVLDQATARNPGDRFKSADEFSSALAAALDAVDFDSKERVDLSRIPVSRGGELSGSANQLNLTMAEKLTPATLGQLEGTLTGLIGPIAKVALVRASRETTDADKLLTRLSAMIPATQEAKRFRETAEQWLRKDQGVAAAQLDAVISNDDIREATRLLLPYIGPLAKLIAEREAKTAIGRKDYIEHVARAITDDKDRAQFLANQGTQTSKNNSQ